MNQKQKDKFNKALQKLGDLMSELNSGIETWEIRYNLTNDSFCLYKRDVGTYKFERMMEVKCPFDFYSEE